MKHESDDDINRNWCTWNDLQRTILKVLEIEGQAETTHTIVTKYQA